MEFMVMATICLALGAVVGFLFGIRTSAKLRQEAAEFRERMASLTTANQNLLESKTELVRDGNLKNKDYETKIDHLLKELESRNKELIALKEQEPIRYADYEKRVESLNAAHQNVERERAREEKIKAQAQFDNLQGLKETWSRHEADSEEKMKQICQLRGIEYVDKEKFPFSGKPDNVVKICGEYIVFDAKSPQGDDLSNFATYVRREAELTKKYSKHETVKKDLFLIVPSNAIAEIRETFIPLGASRVHVITSDALLPILIQLQKIEEYEFAEKMSPEDRERIVTTIGRMAHVLKRRVQVDHYFANESISLLTDAENLPEEILKEAQVIERNSKLNPPLETRAKRIETASLSKENQRLTGRIEGQEIHIGPELVKAIEVTPLYKPTEN